MRFARVKLAALLLGAAACAGEDGANVTIRAFELERAVPPADDRGGLLLVSPRSDLHFRWQVDGEVDRVALSANERVIATFSGGKIATAATDLCSESRCGTANIGEVIYRLQAWDPAGKSVSRNLPVRVAQQGLQILSFTTAPDRISPGTSVALAWESSGATGAKLTATPLGGGEERDLGTWEGEGAKSGSFVDEDVRVSTLYRLAVNDDESRTATAEVTLTLQGEAWLTHVEAAPSQVAAGEPVPLSWRSVGLERLSILRDDNGAGITDIRPEELAEGARDVTVEEETTFSFVGVSDDGVVITDRCDDTGCAPAQVTVTVHPGPAVVSFVADEPEIPIGGKTVLRWEVTQADEVVITYSEPGGTGQLAFPAGATEVEVAPSDSARYTLVASGGGRNASRQLVLGVRPKVKLTGPNDVFPGEEYELSWTSAGATRLQLLVDGQPVDVSGEPVVAGSMRITASNGLPRGGSFDAVIIAEDDETPRRSAQDEIEIDVE